MQFNPLELQRVRIHIPTGLFSGDTIPKVFEVLGTDISRNGKPLVKIATLNSDVTLNIEPECLIPVEL